VALGVARTFSPDIVFAWQTEGIGIGTAIALQGAGYPVLHRRGDEAMADLLDRMQLDKNVMWRKCRQLLYGVEPCEVRSVDMIVISTFLYERHVSAGFNANRIVTIWNGVPESAIISNSVQPHAGNTKRLLYAGRVSPEKGIHIAIQALALMREKSRLAFNLDIVGPAEKPYLESLKQLIHSLALDDTVNFLVSRESDDMWTLYDQYDALVFPSIVREGFGRVVIEAMARGLPVIAVDRGGPRDIITTGVDGILIKPEDADALASALVELFTNNQLLHSIGTEAIETVRRRFTLERSVECIEQRLFEQLSRNAHEHSGNAQTTSVSVSDELGGAQNG
jgi:glycosyltransferase involved in cell wall biosynthesis